MSPSTSAVSQPVQGGFQQPEETMDEILTFDQIKARYAPDRVLIGELETEENLDVPAGKVLFHGPGRDEVYRRVKELMPGRFAVQFLGTFPEDVVMML